MYENKFSITTIIIITTTTTTTSTIIIIIIKQSVLQQVCNPFQSEFPHRP